MPGEGCILPRAAVPELKHTHTQAHNERERERERERE
jgi:hypothetical protein